MTASDLFIFGRMILCSGVVDFARYSNTDEVILQYFNN